jgi:TonB family protein
VVCSFVKGVEMTVSKFISGALLLALTFTLGVVVVYFTQQATPKSATPIQESNGSGVSSSRGDFGSFRRVNRDAPKENLSDSDSEHFFRILEKPKALYTDEALEAGTQGTVILKVAFLASGHIGSISVVKGLPNGLTEMAVAAARKIRFEPTFDNGKPASITRTVEYKFSLYINPVWKNQTPEKLFVK